MRKRVARRGCAESFGMRTMRARAAMQANSFVIGCGVLLLLSRCALTAQQFGQYGDFNYRVDGRDVTILEYTRHEPVGGFAVTIPRTIEGLVVRAIGLPAF